MTSENGATLAVVDTSTKTVAGTIALGEGMRPMGVKASADGSFVAVSTGRSRQVLFVDPATNTVTGSVNAGERPWGLAIARDGWTLCTANGPSNEVSIVDVASRTVTANIPVGDRPWGAILIERF